MKLKNGIDFLMKKNQITVLQGSASFQDQKTVAVSGNKSYLVRAKNIIIASGSKISNINIPGIDLSFVLNSKSALSYDQLPSSITIIGGGVIGMEFAFLYRNLGVEVQVIEFMDRLLAMMDEDISEEILRIAREKGIKVQLSSKVVRIQESDQGQAVVTYEKDGKETLSVSEKVLVAIGREPELEGLEVANAGIELNDRGRGIRVNAQMQTNVSSIYAIGDVTNKIQLAHVASAQAIVAVDHILGKNTCMDYSIVPNVVFTSPEIASVGFTEKQLQEQKANISVSKVGFAGNGKALTMNEAEGFVKLIKDNESGKIVGASMIGPDAASLISTLTVSASNGLTADQLSQTIFAHPTTGEVIHEAAMGLGLGGIHE